MRNIKILICVAIGLAFFSSCSEETIELSNNTEFSSVQIQKFDYGTLSGRGEIFQGSYSTNRDTIYFDVTYFPDQEAPTYTDWQFQASIPSGAKVVPSLGGVRDLSQPVNVTMHAPDGSSKSNYVLKLRIYEVPFAELERGFGRYSQLFELTAEQLGGWASDNQRSCAVIDNYLIVSNMDKPFLVYDKLTGSRIDKNIPLPAGETFYQILADKDGILLATTASSFSESWRPNLRVYRWINGLDQEPELFFELPLTTIPLSGSHGIGFRATIWGATQRNAQMMFDVDGRGTADERAVRISIEDGVPSQSPDIFNTGVGTRWSGTAVAMSETGRLPYATASLGFPPEMKYAGENGVETFVTASNSSNFLNKIIGDVRYFEFNNSKYVALSSISWPGIFRMLIFCLDDPGIIAAGTNQPEKYELLNPFMEEALFSSGGDKSGVTIQVQEDGKTALVYFMSMNAGIVAYELTNMGTSSE